MSQGESDVSEPLDGVGAATAARDTSEALPLLLEGFKSMPPSSPDAYRIQMLSPFSEAPACATVGCCVSHVMVLSRASVGVDPPLTYVWYCVWPWLGTLMRGANSASVMWGTA